MVKSLNDLALFDDTDAVVLMLHRDVQRFVGLEDSYDNAEKIRSLTLDFRSNLETVLLHMNATMPTTKICVTSPSLVGEGGPVFKPNWATQLVQRKAEEFGQIALEMHLKYPKIAFLDIHKALKDSLPPIWPFFSGWLTHGDGQTLNSRGTNIEVRLLSELMLRYYQERIFDT